MKEIFDHGFTDPTELCAQLRGVSLLEGEPPVEINYPPNETERLRALRDCHVLDTPPEQGFDDLTALAAHLCEAPIALISLIDEDRQWFKSRVGITAQETARDISFCTHAILQPDLFVVRDAQQDVRFADNPLVQSDPNIRFYAGAPLVTEDGCALGTLCVIDRVPRELNPEQRQALRVLSHHVVSLLELRRAAEARRKAEEALTVNEETVKVLRQQLDDRAQFGRLVGKSKGMEQVFQHIRDVARVETTVLIEGKTGTGKELVARAIHEMSRRRERPFVTVNCAGLTESLVASQLFGHKKGAFTGAVENQEGLFEAANGGTLLLDEIGDVPAAIQTALLRVLQEREVTRVGESKPRKVDVRVLAATHHDLAQDVEAGHFRADLLYRIRVGRIQLPSLKERREDIPLLVQTFLRQVSASSGKALQQVSAAAMQQLMEYPWPGNVRELRAAIEYAVIHSHEPVIQVTDLPPEVTVSRRETPTVGEPEERKASILAALEQAGGNRKTAAKLLGIGRATLYRHLRELEIPTER